MTNTVQNHIHLWKAGATYAGHDATSLRVSMGGIVDMPMIFASHVRSLNGTPHAHVLTSAGVPVKFKNVKLRLMVTDDQFDALADLQGYECYYMPIKHMEDDEQHQTGNVVDSPGYKVFMMPITNPGMIDPMLEWRLVELVLEDHSS